MAAVTPSQKLLEDLWRERLDAHRVSYQQAKIGYAQAIKQGAEGSCPGVDGSFAIQKALRAENRALSEYLRVLRIFTELILHGNVPEEPGIYRPDEPGLQLRNQERARPKGSCAQ